MLPRRGVPIPARRLDLEVVATERSSELSGPVLESYARNKEEVADDGVRVLRDLPFGDAFAPEDTPFFLADTQPNPVEVDDSDTDGIPVGLPDLIGFTDVEAPVEEPAKVPVVEGSPVASSASPVVVVVASLIGVVVGAVGMWLVG